MKSIKFLLVLFVLPFLYYSCIKDKCEKKYRTYAPIYKLRAAVLAEVKMLAPKATAQAGKIFSYGNFLFINEIDKGIHVIDNTNPETPVKVGFLNIEGNLDLWVKNNLLYADCYDNLLVIDIHDIHNIKLVESLPAVFPQRSFGIVIDESKGYVVGWEQRDTTVSFNCDETNSDWMINKKGINAVDLMASSGSSGFVPPTGVAGSLTRFNCTGNYLYCVDDISVHTFDISQQKPTLASNVSIGWGVETIYSFNNNLFLGTNTGVLIYSLSNPASPTYVNKMQHVRTCDPVITDGINAYVTLRGGSPCGGFTNQMDVLDVKNIQNVSLIKSYTLTHPYGLGMDDKYVFICDDGYGIRIFDRTDATQMTEKYKITIERPRDIIVLNHVLLILTDTKMMQYDYSDLNNIRKVSEIN